MWRSGHAATCVRAHTGLLAGVRVCSHRQAACLTVCPPRYKVLPRSTVAPSLPTTTIGPSPAIDPHLPSTLACHRTLRPPSTLACHRTLRPPSTLARHWTLCPPPPPDRHQPWPAATTRPTSTSPTGINVADTTRVLRANATNNADSPPQSTPTPTCRHH
ncbi:uncharacterized protein PSFLO_06935 [Pseudozyma flocculosa]|uniref:Uncharacterized protein n=1 Tax=Pseudozyma flocculosa TaxID=84751 RepID=A0A5C3FAH0_9BASI|nr:uncharacterized protein PSFLO_06935 [Pseudozyma flocculosa]